MREEFERLTDLVLDDKVRVRQWKDWYATMDHPWDEFDCSPAEPCDINQWIRSDGDDTGFVFCNDCGAVGITPQEFYERSDHRR